MKGKEITDFGNGIVVWARFGNYPWWPSLIIDHLNEEKLRQGESLPASKKKNRLVMFFNDDNRVAVVHRQELREFTTNMRKVLEAGRDRKPAILACENAQAYILKYGEPSQKLLLVENPYELSMEKDIARPLPVQRKPPAQTESTPAICKKKAAALALSGGGSGNASVGKKRAFSDDNVDDLKPAADSKRSKVAFSMLTRSAMRKTFSEDTNTKGASNDTSNSLPVPPTTSSSPGYGVSRKITARSEKKATPHASDKSGTLPESGLFDYKEVDKVNAQKANLASNLVESLNINATMGQADVKTDGPIEGHRTGELSGYCDDWIREFEYCRSSVRRLREKRSCLLKKIRMISVEASSSDVRRNDIGTELSQISKRAAPYSDEVQVEIMKVTERFKGEASTASKELFVETGGEEQETIAKSEPLQIEQTDVEVPSTLEPEKHDGMKKKQVSVDLVQGDVALAKGTIPGQAHSLLKTGSGTMEENHENLKENVDTKPAPAQLGKPSTRRWETLPKVKAIDLLICAVSTFCKLNPLDKMEITNTPSVLEEEVQLRVRVSGVHRKRLEVLQTLTIKELFFLDELSAHMPR